MMRRPLDLHVWPQWWMGGALRVAGNALPGESPGGAPADGTAEWNAYWDPPSTNTVMALLPPSMPFVMVPLDATNQVNKPLRVFHCL